MGGLIGMPDRNDHDFSEPDFSDLRTFTDPTITIDSRTSVENYLDRCIGADMKRFANWYNGNVRDYVARQFRRFIDWYDNSGRIDLDRQCKRFMNWYKRIVRPDLLKQLLDEEMTRMIVKDGLKKGIKNKR